MKMTTKTTPNSELEKVQKQVEHLRALQQKSVIMKRKVSEFLQKVSDVNSSEDMLKQL